MKEFWYDDIDRYLKLADAYDNPKTVKMYELVNSSEPGKKLLRAVTYLRTALVGWQKLVTQDTKDDFIVKLESHGHSLGVILEVGRFE
ncbi:MAG: hypothetical protein AM325_016020 [Candidatus Thorarchaeota archaeon SMTZ1-45]|nr:MAG: hypothetical protein AM325_16820 [Candidatus Thorarchaeota archaeon SMTZ1-45]